MGRARRHAGEHLEHVLELHLAAPGGIGAHLAADKEQIEQALARIDGVDERRSHCHRLLERRVFALLGARIEYQRMAFEKLVLEFLHHR